MTDGGGQPFLSVQPMWLNREGMIVLVDVRRLDAYADGRVELPPVGWFWGAHWRLILG